jgi:chloride channel 3/4/5
LNAYPFLNNKHKPVFTSDLADIVPRVRRERVIDISVSPMIPASSLRNKLEILHQAGEVDGGLPIIRDDVLVGLIPAPDLEFALDNLDDETSTLCLMATVNNYDSDDEGRTDPTDFTPYIDPVRYLILLESSHFLTYSGPCGIGHSFSYGLSIRVLCQAWSKVYLCTKRGSLRWNGMSHSSKR